MTTLAQLLAIEGGLKSRSHRTVTDLYHKLKVRDLFFGLSRTYRPKDEEGEGRPSESVPVRANVENVFSEVAATLTPYWDLTITKDAANTKALADVTIPGQGTLVIDVPVTYLLFLEKQLGELRTMVADAPVLSTDEEWNLDEENSVWRTPPVETLSTKKVRRNHTKAEATAQHPAQVEVYEEDVTVGTWQRTLFSQALSAGRKAKLLARIDTLQTAVKFAREEANSAQVEDRKVGAVLFGYLLD